MKIIGLTKEQLLALGPYTVHRLLTADEILYIGRTLDAFWSFDYDAADAGRPGKHAELKSLQHSDGFFASRFMLRHRNIATLMALQIIMRLKQIGITRPDYVVGIPDGATVLGELVAKELSSKLLEMEKIGGKLVPTENVPNGSSLLLVEDFCTRGTGFREAVTALYAMNPTIVFVGYDPVILNRGGLHIVSVPGVGEFTILAVATKRINDFDPKLCPLCGKGSIPMKPKVTDDAWQELIISQRA